MKNNKKILLVININGLYLKRIKLLRCYNKKKAIIVNCYCCASYY